MKRIGLGVALALAFPAAAQDGGAKPDEGPELLDASFYGFEGPYITKGKKPLGNGARQVGDTDEWRENWYFHQAARDYFSIAEEESLLAGKRSLKLVRNGKLPEDKLIAFAPLGSINVPKGNYYLSVRIFVPEEAGSSVVQFIVDDPYYQSPEIDLGKFPRDQWVNLPIPIKRGSKSGPRDRLRIVLINKGADVGGTYYFDEISLKAAN